MWRVSTGECLLTLAGHTDLVRCIRFNEQYIVSGSYDRYKSHQRTKHTHTHTPPPPPPPPHTHALIVNSPSLFPYLSGPSACGTASRASHCTQWRATNTVSCVSSLINPRSAPVPKTIALSCGVLPQRHSHLAVSSLPLNSLLPSQPLCNTTLILHDYKIINYNGSI